MQSVLKWDLKVLPHVIDWFERARTVENNCYRPGVRIGDRKLDTIYQFVRVMPEVFKPVRAAGEKRKRVRKDFDPYLLVVRQSFTLHIPQSDMRRRRWFLSLLLTQVICQTVNWYITFRSRDLCLSCCSCMWLLSECLYGSFGAFGFWDWSGAKRDWRHVSSPDSINCFNLLCIISFHCIL